MFTPKQRRSKESPRHKESPHRRIEAPPSGARRGSPPKGKRPKQQSGWFDAQMAAEPAADEPPEPPSSPFAKAMRKYSALTRDALSFTDQGAPRELLRIRHAKGYDEHERALLVCYVAGAKLFRRELLDERQVEAESIRVVPF